MKTLNVIWLALAFALHATAADVLTEKLQRGLFEEEANHNLDAAIKEYQSVVAQSDEQRKVIATALFRLGECYRKLGRTNDANAHYQRILRDFAEQEQLVKLSRELLPRPSVTGAPYATTTDPTAVNFLREEIRVAEQVVQTGERQLTAGRGVRSDVLNAKKEVLRLKRGLPENAAPSRQSALLEEQIAIVKQYLSYLAQLVPDRRPPGEDLSIQRELLSLQRELALANASPAEGGTVASAGATDEEEKEVRRIQAMIKDSPDLINARDNSGYTPLHAATERGQLVVARFLLANKADVNARASNSGETPLHFAARQGHKSMVELLIENGANVNTANLKGGDTPLHLAVEKGFRAVIEVLLARKADINARGNRGETPLHRAVVNGFKSITELLLAQGADVNAKTSDDTTPLHVAARISNRDLVELLLAKGATIDAVNSFKTTPLHFAVQNKNLPIVELLLEKKANPNLADATGTTPLSRAVQDGSMNLISPLLASGADPNIGDRNGITPLHWTAMTQGGEEMAEVLLKNKASVTTRVSWEPGAPAPRNKGNNNVIPHGATPLGLAVDYFHVRTAELLLDHGADVETLANPRNAGALPALEAAINNNSRPLVKLLLERKANPNRVLSDGKTPLMRAAHFGNKEIVELLLAHGADVNALAPGGWYALFIATDQRKPEIAALLRQHGAIEDLARSSSITVARGATRQTIFEKGTNDLNRFTLFEVLAQHFGPGQKSFQFPDFARVQVRSIKNQSSEPGRTIDLETAFQFTNCTVNTWLAWGDLIELPEQDHLANVPWDGLSTSARDTLKQCLRKQVSIIVKGQTNRVVLTPALAAPGFGGAGVPFRGARTLPPTSLPGAGITTTGVPGGIAGIPAEPERSAEIESNWQRLNDVVRGVNVIRSSSDLTRVKVTRSDDGTANKREMVFDLVRSDKASDLWLRDGDVIEIPEKP